MSTPTLLWALVAVFAGGGAIWVFLGPDPLVRVAARGRAKGVSRLPAWAQPVPHALPATTRRLLGLGSGMAVVVWCWGSTPLLALLGPPVGVVVWIASGRLRAPSAKDVTETIHREAPGAFDLIVSCLKAGLPLRGAVETIAGVYTGPLAERFERIRQGISVGMSDAEAWESLRDDEVLSGLARDVARAAQWGTALGDVFDQHSADLRRDYRTDAVARARAVGVKSVVPLSVCYLPAFMLVGVVPVIAGGVMSALFG